MKDKTYYAPYPTDEATKANMDAITRELKDVAAMEGISIYAYRISPVEIKAVELTSSSREAYFRNLTWSR